MIDLDRFWSFVGYRPGLSATAQEWEACLGPEGWQTLRGRLFCGDGVTGGIRRPGDGRTLKVVPLTGGRYGLVCTATGDLVESGLTEQDMVAHRLNLRSLRVLVAEALDLVPDRQPVGESPRAVSVGAWSPVTGTDIPVFMILPPTARLLTSEIKRLLIESQDRFVLLVPQHPQLSQGLRREMERQRASVVPLSEVLQCDPDGRFSSSPAWTTYCDAYCQQHLPERMVPAGPEYLFAKKGMWSIRFQGKETYLDGDLKGAAFIHYLIRHQGQEMHVIRMMADVAGAEREQIIPEAEGLDLAPNDAGDLVDKKTVRDCRQRHEELEIEQEKARRAGTKARLAEIKEEIGQIVAYLSASLGLHGKSRKALDDVSKVRRRISRVINIAYEKIGRCDSDLEAHLRNSIRTKINMSYAPDQPVDWVLE